MTTALLEGWDIATAIGIPWTTWGEGDLARAKVLASGDGYVLALVEAKAGYTGTPHDHQHTEMLYVLAGTLQNQGREMVAGDAYVASAGSRHSEFRAVTDATYLSIFKL
jgi:quercetin dioxygenase-like cupin family protein